MECKNKLGGVNELFRQFVNWDSIKVKEVIEDMVVEENEYKMGG